MNKIDRIKHYSIKNGSEKLNIHSFNFDYALSDDYWLPENRSQPFKLDFTMVIIVIRGVSKGYIDLNPYEIKAPCIFIVLPGQILIHEYISEDFEARLIFMSNTFSNLLMFQEGLPHLITIGNNSTIPLSDYELNLLLSYYSILKSVITNKESQFRLEILKHIMMAFFYGTNNLFKEINLGDKEKMRNKIIVNQFIMLVREHFKSQRNLKFYSNKLCLTPKYLSSIVKKQSHLSANEWIDRFIILEAKVLLKSTDLSIRQISDELNFPSQSFFGKYFKRIVGKSPIGYRD